MAASPRWTVVLPFYNERDFIAISLTSLARQAVPFRLILVDNGSTDGSGEIALSICRFHRMDATLVREARPGKVSALRAGLSRVTSEFVATCDADTAYPPDYLAVAARLLGTGAAAAVACTTAPGASPWERRMAGLRMAATARLLPQQCHNGGAAQVFRTDALRAAGGFDPRIWNWVLEDHEIMARVEAFGPIAYDSAFHCMPTERPRPSSTTGWTLAEQIRYHLTTGATRQSFFHDFLGPRLRQRALTSDRLRREAHQSGDVRGLGALYSLRG